MKYDPSFSDIAEAIQSYLSDHEEAVDRARSLFADTPMYAWGETALAATPPTSEFRLDILVLRSLLWGDLSFWRPCV